MRDIGGKGEEEIQLRPLLTSALEGLPILCITTLLPQSPLHFTRKPSARVSHTLHLSYLSHVTATAT